jgi:hypothetical protein
MGSIRPSGGTEVERFKACDEDENLYVVIKYELIIKSGEIRRDGMNTKASVRPYFELDNGTPVDRVKDDSEAFQVFGTDKIIWKIGKRK